MTAKTGFTIVGAGAIGAIVGVHLLRAGHEVTFVEANRAHVEAMRRDGLRLTGALEAVVKPTVLLPTEVGGTLSRVLLAVKSRHTVPALEPLARWLADDGYVVSLQNGLEEYKIAGLVGEARTIGAFLTFGGHYHAPGEIVYGGRGSFKIGEPDGRMSARLEPLRDVLSALQPVEITDNIFGFLWAKMALGAVYTGTALVSADVPDIYDHAAYREMLGSLAGEVVAVAEAVGVRPEDFDGFDPKVFRPGRAPDADAIAAAWQGQRQYWQQHDTPRTGIWRDLAVHKRETEVDHLIGAVVERAREQGVPVPRLEALVELVHAVERGTAELGWHNLDALVAVDERERA